jgi:hypothetical protein
MCGDAQGGSTALMMASVGGDAAVVALLIDKHASIDAVDYVSERARAVVWRAT